MIEQIYMLGYKRRALVALFVLLITLVVGTGMLRLQIDTSVDSLIPAGDPSRLVYEKVMGEFGTDNKTIIYISDPDLWTPDKLAKIEKLHFENFEVIVVDNGSMDGSRELIEEKYPWVKLIKLPYNKGFAIACNEGIKASDAEYIVLLNNDIEVTPDWLTELYEGMERHPECGMGTTKMMAAAECKNKPTSMKNTFNRARIAQRLSVKSIIPCATLCGTCISVK